MMVLLVGRTPTPFTPNPPSIHTLTHFQMQVPPYIDTPIITARVYSRANYTAGVFIRS